MVLLRLVNSGLQDERLLPPKGRPNLQFFQKVFIKAGRFTTEWVRLEFENKPTFGQTAFMTLPRKGHLITRLYLATHMPDIKTVQDAAAAEAKRQGLTVLNRYGWTNGLGHALLASASVDIGGDRVEEINGQLLEMLDEYQTPLEKLDHVNDLIQRKENFAPGDFQESLVITPLPFWFSRGDHAVGLPIDAINADQIRISVRFAAWNSLWVSSQQKTPIPNVVGSAYVPIEGAKLYTNGNFSAPQVSGLDGNPTSRRNANVIQGLRMPTEFLLGDCYILAEYIYLDQPEANRFRIADIQYPILQHYILPAIETKGMGTLEIPLRIPNPTRDIYFYSQPFDAPLYNAPFLATRDIGSSISGIAPWWPVSESGLPCYSLQDSEPFQHIELVYQGSLTRYIGRPTLFRCFSPEKVKTPWFHKYYYNISFGLESSAPSIPCGVANLDKVQIVELRLRLNPLQGSVDPNNVTKMRLFVFIETYNILRIYGGRAGLLFTY